MILSLTCKNLFLFDEVHLTFSSGFHIFTGETGAGKSNILSSLALLTGIKADSSMIKKGADFAFIEASFACDKNDKRILQLLQEEGIEGVFDREITLRREITQKGKNRCFIDDQQIPVSTIKKIGSFFIEIVTQSQSQSLLSPSYQAYLLDLFAEVEEKKKSFSDLYKEQAQIETQIRHLICEKEHLLRNKEEENKEKEWIESIELKEGEEETLIKEHDKLIGIHEIKELIESSYQMLYEEKSPITYQMGVLANHLLRVEEIDPQIKETKELAQSICVEIEELIYQLRSYKSSLESSPQRIDEIDRRLAEIHELKRKYGPTTADVMTHLEKLQKREEQLYALEERIEKLQQQKQTYQKDLDRLADHLSLKRKEGAIALEKQVTEEIQKLHMPYGLFKIEVMPSERTSFGDDRIFFTFSANANEPLMALGQVASGGELSRLLLVIKSILADRDKTPTLIFDEIDANVGGRAATLIGEKLFELGKCKQIFSITHFVQVAKIAKHHYIIQKHESEKGSKSDIFLASQKAREKEYLRMLGKTVKNNLLSV